MKEFVEPIEMSFDRMYYKWYLNSFDYFGVSLIATPRLFIPEWTDCFTTKYP